MSALVSEFLTLAGLFWTFMETYMIPTSVSDINIIHVAIWVPIMLGLLTATVSTIRSLWGRKGRRG